MWESYVLPTSVAQALAVLQAYQGRARLIAGGTDLIPKMKAGKRRIDCLVDISRIKGLQGIEEDGGDIRIGAAVTHAEVASSRLIRERATVLAEAALSVGSPLVRNQGTVAGNVVSAQPAGDAAVALFALEASIEITGQNGVRLVPIAELYQDVGISRVDSTAEIVTAIHFKGSRGNQASAFARLAQRQALALPMLNTAVVVAIRDGRFAEARIVVAPVAPLPLRARQAEQGLKDAPVSADRIVEAAEAAAQESRPRDSLLRGSAEYRRNMVRVLVRRALEQATTRLIGKVA
ncbi:MAG: FAD binding domain-containing protein [Chloroflexi bacterium]|nr:FAD binding domain-containing protein [Chloroflexota bacterium]